jgi:hypothetical protein
MLTLERIEPDDLAWARMDAFEDRNVFQTREWVSFVQKTQGAEPVIAEVRDGATHVGYFTGLVVSRFGIRILGSPMAGWSTWYMGFNLQEQVSRVEAIEALPRFAFTDLRCMHLEIGDRRMQIADLEERGFETATNGRVEVDLTRSEDAIFADMSSACRRCVRKAEKSGVTIEVATDPRFADDYYAQLEDVFAKQSLVPTYDVTRVRELVSTLGTERLLLLRARDGEGNCIATGIFPGMNRSSFFWGGASYRRHQHLRPNELLMWHALRYWKTRGAEFCDLGGGGGFDYKRKYGTRDVLIPFAYKSRYRMLWSMRNLAAEAFERRQQLLGRLMRRP